MIMLLHIVYLPSCLSREAVMGTCALRVPLPSSHLFTKPGGDITRSLFIAERQTGKMQIPDSVVRR